MFAAVATAAVLARTTGCQAKEVRLHDEIVYGHYASARGARRLRSRLIHEGFKGTTVENDGCGDYEVEQDGADTEQQRSSVALEAEKAGYQVTFEQIGQPIAPPKGQVYGVFGSERTLAAANALAQRAAGNGFRYIDLVASGRRWLVVMPQVPERSALPIAKEAARAGFHLRFFH